MLRVYVSLRCGTGARRPPRRAATMTMAAIAASVSSVTISATFAQRCGANRISTVPCAPAGRIQPVL